MCVTGQLKPWKSMRRDRKRGDQEETRTKQTTLRNTHTGETTEGRDEDNQSREDLEDTAVKEGCSVRQCPISTEVRDYRGLTLLQGIKKDTKVMIFFQIFQ